jgi:hypothetical protein
MLYKKGVTQRCNVFRTVNQRDAGVKLGGTNVKISWKVVVKAMEEQMEWLPVK